MRKIKNSDFKILLPEEVAGRELGANDSVELRIYTVNADNYYKFEYEGGQVPEEQKVDASCMVTMESGVVMYLLLAHIADASMPDGYFDLQEEITSDYYWIKTQEQSAQEQINELRKDILEEAEVREAADDQLNKSIDSLSDDLDALNDQVDDLEAIHNADIEALSGAVSSMTEDMTSKFNQIDADQAAQNTNIAAVSGAVDNLDDRLSRRIDTVDTENIVQNGKIQSLSGAIDTERSVRIQAIDQLSATHAEDIEYLNQRIDNLPQFDPSTIEGEITALDNKVDRMGDSVSALTDSVAENKQDITALENQMTSKADASSLQNYAQASALTAVQTDVEDLTEEVDYHTQNIADLQANKLDASAYTQVDLSNYYTKDVIDENERVTSEALNDLNAKKLDVSAYTSFDPSVLDDYQPVSGMSGYATTADTANLQSQIDDKAGADDVQFMYDQLGTSIGNLENEMPEKANLSDLDGYVSQEDYDSAQQATSAALNELNIKKLDSSAYTEFDSSVLDDYVSWQDFNSYMSSKVYSKSDIDTMLGDYYDKTEIDTMIGDINAALSNINGV